MAETKEKKVVHPPSSYKSKVFEHFGFYQSKLPITAKIKSQKRTKHFEINLVIHSIHTRLLVCNGCVTRTLTLPEPDSMINMIAYVPDLQL